MKTSSYKSFLRNYYLSIFFYDFIFAYAIYTVLFNIKGLSTFEISILLAWWALTSALFEIPSGALADYWSRKKILTLSPLIKILCFVTWFFANGNFYLYALGFLFWSISQSLVSGTREALLYDELTFFGKKEDYERALSKRNFYFNISIGTSYAIGGFIAHYYLDYILIISIIPLFLSTIFAFMMTESPKVKSTEEVKYLKFIKLAYEEIKTNKMLRYLFIYSFGISIFGDIEEFDQLYFQLAELPIFFFGIAGLIWALFRATGSYFAHKLKKLNFIYYINPFVCFVLLILVGLFPSIPMIGILLLSYLIISPLYILIESKIQHNITSISRATITSVNTLIITFFGVGIILVFGGISKIWNLQTIYIASGFFLLVFGIWAFVKKRIF
jgi:MFS family permease